MTFVSDGTGHDYVGGKPSEEVLSLYHTGKLMDSEEISVGEDTWKVHVEETRIEMLCEVSVVLKDWDTSDEVRNLHFLQIGQLLEEYPSRSEVVAHGAMSDKDVALWHGWIVSWRGKQYQVTTGITRN